jgi:hypothetical protein
MKRDPTRPVGARQLAAIFQWLAVELRDTRNVPAVSDEHSDILSERRALVEWRAEPMADLTHDEAADETARGYYRRDRLPGQSSPRQ